MHWRRNLWTVSAGLFLAQISFSLIVPLLPPYLLELGLRHAVSTWSGLVFSLNALALAVMTPIWGSLSDYYGRRIMLIRSGIGVAAAYFLMGLVRDHLQLSVLRLADGAVGGLVPAGVMLLVANTPEEWLAFALGIVQTAAAVGGTLGPFLGGVIAGSIGIRGSLFFSAGLLVPATLLTFFGTREEYARPAVRQSFRRDLGGVLAEPSLRVILIAFMLVQAGTVAVQPILPLFIAALVKVDAVYVTGIVFALTGLSTAIGAPFVTKMRRWSYLTLLKGGILAAAGMSLLQACVRSVVLLGGLRFVFGFASAVMTVSGNVLIAQAVPREDRGKVVGVMHSVSALGWMVGPMIGGYLGDRLGLAAAFLGSALLFLLAGGSLCWGRRLVGLTRVSGADRGICA